MRNKGLAFLCVFVLTATGLCGCGQTKQTGTDATSTETVENSNGKAEEAKSGDISLKFWCDTDELELFQEMINHFIEIHKSEANITVEYELIGAADCKDTILADVDNCADVFSMPDDQLLTLAAAGVLEPVYDGDVIAKRNLDESVAAASVNGSVYAYPLTADNGYFLYYDKDYFTEEDVKTLDRILEVCEQNEKKFVMDWSSGWYLYSFFGNTGLTLSLNDDGLTNSCNWDATDTPIKGTDVAHAMLDISASPAFVCSGEFPTMAKSGDAIAIVSGVWDIAAMKEAYGDDYGACKLPTYTCAGQQIQMSSFTGYRMLGVNSYSKNRAWAEKLAEYLSNEENQILRFERAERGPSNKNAAASDAVGKVPAIRAVQEQAKYGIVQKVGPKFWTPTTNFGRTMADGNPNNANVRVLLETMVNGITE